MVGPVIVHKRTEQTSGPQEDTAWDATARLGDERFPSVGQRIDGTDLRADLAGVDELSELDELGAIRVANEEHGADVVAIRWGR